MKGYLLPPLLVCLGVGAEIVTGVGGLPYLDRDFIEGIRRISKSPARVEPN